MKHIISLGAGVQSSTMALMAKHGEILPMPDAAVFADTQDESKQVYKWLDHLEELIGDAFPVYRVSKGSLSESSLTPRVSAKGIKYSKTSIPFYTLNGDGSGGMIPNRGCTYDFKIQPIRKLVKQLAGIKRGQTEVGVSQWIGISLDEVTRMKDARDVWCKNRWPLIEKRMTRQDCLRWMADHGYPVPPRSACVYCPFHDDKEWRRLKTDEPEEFAKAVQFEKDVQTTKGGDGNFASVPFLHASRRPLDEVDFSTLAERNGQINLFENECEGMCGV
jgi:hypothetical protein